MPVTDNYLDYLEEDFTFVNKVFKAPLLKSITQKVKKTVKDNEVNIPALKAALKPIPVIKQEKINIFLDKYIPNYTAKYNSTKKYFDKKYPTAKNTDVISGMTVIASSLDDKKTLKDQVKRTERLYSSSLGTSGAGVAFVRLLVGMALTMTVFSTPEIFGGAGKLILAGTVGVLLMLSAVMSIFE
ncbi:MAG: hypothetical protein ACTSVB_01320 [Candidatus Heimdallarchaeaceae archaeon]